MNAFLQCLPVIAVAEGETTLNQKNFTGGSLDSGSYLLTGDINLTSGITIESESTVTIDLNGYVLDRGLTDSAAVTNGYVIHNKGNLTIKDSYPSYEHKNVSLPDGGCITGGNNNGDGGGGGSSSTAQE